MPSCHDMKMDEVYVCGECGLELQVIKECHEVGKEVSDCGCTEHCTFACCGQEMKLKG